MNEKASWHRSQYLQRELIRDFMHAEYPSKDKEWTGGGGGPGGGGASVNSAEFIIIVAMGACWCLSQSCVYIHLQY